MRQKQESVQVLLSLFIAGVAIALIVWLLQQLTNKPVVNNPSSPPTTVLPTQTNPRLSLGSKILIGANSNPEKEAGVQAGQTHLIDGIIAGSDF